MGAFAAPFPFLPSLARPSSVVRLVTANDADMCAAATDAGVVTEFGGGGGGRKERGGARRKRERGREGEREREEGRWTDRGDKESTTDRTTTTMNERGAKLGRIAPLPLALAALARAERQFPRVWGSGRSMLWRRPQQKNEG